MAVWVWQNQVPRGFSRQARRQPAVVEVAVPNLTLGLLARGVEILRSRASWLQASPKFLFNHLLT